MDERQERLAQNEEFFREANERVGELAESHLPGDDPYGFFCECSNVSCTFQVELTLAEYRRIRANAGHFFVRLDHQMPEIERIVDEHARYLVVEKHPEPDESTRPAAGGAGRPAQP